MSPKVIIQKLENGKTMISVKTDEPVGTLDLVVFKITAYHVGGGDLVYFLSRENEPDRLLFVREVEAIEKHFSKYPDAVLWFSVIRKSVKTPTQIF